MPSQTWQHRIEAAEAALELLDEAGLDQTTQVDVFGLCEHLNIWLAFMPLDNALGVHLTEGTGGILITTRRPITVQRYTVGHELGHWRLGHGAAADQDAEIFGVAPAERERLAQIFAANLLMPPPLVSTVLERLRGPDDTQITPMHCYGLAREAGVSYEAAVRQMHNLEILSGPQAGQLLVTTPLSIKTELGHGHRPVSGWADVWPVDEYWNDETLHLRIDDEAVISLPENRTTGHRWFPEGDESRHRMPTPAPATFATSSGPPDELEQLALTELLEASSGPRQPPTSILRDLRSRAQSVPSDPDRAELRVEGADLVGDGYLPTYTPTASLDNPRTVRLAAIEGSDSPTQSPAVRAGGYGRRLLSVRFRRPGRHTIKLEYANAYERSEPLDAYVLHALVDPPRPVFSVDQLAHDEDDPDWKDLIRQRQLLAASVEPDSDE